MSPSVQKAARDLVLRRNAGDQVAMGLIQEMEKAAAVGNSKAAAGIKAINAALAKYPGSGLLVQTLPPQVRDRAIASSSTFGGEEGSVLSYLKGATSHSPFAGEGGFATSPEELTGMLYSLGKCAGGTGLLAAVCILANGPLLTDDVCEQMNATIPTSIAGSDAIRIAGEVVKQARGVQMARIEGVSLSHLDEDAAWEVE